MEIDVHLTGDNKRVIKFGSVEVELSKLDAEELRILLTKALEMG